MGVAAAVGEQKKAHASLRGSVRNTVNSRTEPSWLLGRPLLIETLRDTILSLARRRGGASVGAGDGIIAPQR